MIVWLASYPRSGKALLRLILHQCFGLSTYSDQPPTVTADVKPLPDYRPLPAPWPRFYEQACGSATLASVMTHRPPCDDAPALYVVRDGRLAVCSYLKFHRSFQAHAQASLLGLIVGDDYYGDWSWHYRQWTERRGPTLVLRYEDLAQPSTALLRSIGEVLGTSPGVQHWDNPVAALRQQRPGLIGAAQPHWQGDSDWDGYADAAFHLLHGPLLHQLGYADSTASEAAVTCLTRGQRDVLLSAQRTARRAAELQQVCDARQRVIDGLAGSRSAWL
jgi:hypothetical protein